jgi:type III secretion system TyeA family effector delivery regulator
MNDLRRLLILLGLTQTCDELAQTLVANQTAQDSIASTTPRLAKTKPIDGARILKLLITIAEQAWVDSDWLESRIALLIGSGDLTPKLSCAYYLKTIWKKLPPFFFEDIQKQNQTLSAFENLMIRLAEKE